MLSLVYIGAVFQDRTLRLWNPVKGLFIKEYRGHGYEVRDVSVCSDNSKMASVGGDRQVGPGLTELKGCSHSGLLHMQRAGCNLQVLGKYYRRGC